MKIGFYPGCSLQGSSREYAESLRAIAPALQWELCEVPDWNCCGASAAHSLDATLALALPARVLALAEQAGLGEVLVPCSACYSRLLHASHELAHDAGLRARIEEIIGLDFAASTRVRNVLEVLQRSAETLPAIVSRPFEHKVACYYGCYLTRPAALVPCTRNEDPQEMEEILKRVGATPVDWSFKVECCGAGLSVPRVDLVGELGGRIMDDALYHGAEAMVVACPMCHTNLDLRRQAIEKRLQRRIEIPVLYISQVIGLALGLSHEELGMHRHHVPVALSSPVPAASKEGA